MATTATLSAVSATGTNNSSSNIDSSKRKSEVNIISTIGRKPVQRDNSNSQQTSMKSSNETDNSDDGTKTNNFIRSTSTFRIPKIERLSPDYNQLSPVPMVTDTNDSMSSLQVTNNSSLNRQSIDELNSQQGKRKFSLSQYKEHKRLKSNEGIHNSLADTDMRMENIKDSPPIVMDDDPPKSIVSPKIDEPIKDVVIKSNLSEPGVKKIIKKKVIWADEKNQALVQTSFFEIDDSERTDMHAFARTCANNISIAQVEKLLERDLRKQRGLQDINSLDNDDKQNLPPLPALIRILLPDTIPTAIVKSHEYSVQEERERTVLQALFIRSFLPDSPGEPDGDLLGNSTIERNEPKLIPLDDDASLRAPNKVSPVNNNNSTPAIICLVSTNPTPTVTPSLSSFSFDNASPEVAQILAQAKGNLSSATTNNLPSTTTTTTTNTLINPSITTNPTLASLTNLSATSNLLSTWLNAARTNGIDTTNPIANLLPALSLNFNLPPPTQFPMNSLLANTLSFSLPPPPTINTSIYQSPPATTYNTPPPPISATKPPSVRFVSSLGQQSSRFHNNDYQNSSFRENNRGHNYRRGLHNNNHRRDYYQNRDNNNNNRNIFS